MSEANKAAFNDIYNTTIKDIGGIKDLSALLEVFHNYFSAPDLISDKIIGSNSFNIRSEKTRKKIYWAVNNTILQFLNDDHFAFAENIFTSNIPFDDKKFAFFWHYSLNNRLFREISIEVFAKIYFSGRAAIKKDDIIAFMREKKVGYNAINTPWSEETYYRIATKYLNLLTKMDLVSEGRVKMFKDIKLSSEACVLFLYFTKIFSPENNNILNNELLPLSFISLEDIQGRLKKLSIKGLFDLNFNGVVLNIELIHSYKGICNVLYD